MTTRRIALLTVATAATALLLSGGRRHGCDENAFTTETHGHHRTSGRHGRGRKQRR